MTLGYCGTAILIEIVVKIRPMFAFAQVQFRAKWKQRMRLDVRSDLIGYREYAGAGAGSLSGRRQE